MRNVVFEVPAPPIDTQALVTLLEKRQAVFKPSTVRQHQKNGVVRSTKPEYRNSLSLALREADEELRSYILTVEATVRAHVERAIQELGMRRFCPGQSEISCVAFGDGAFFRKHRDDYSTCAGRRMLSWVYYVSREPRRFSG
jgi:Rps23 Pro-64 3,4-dihydroxylase Tpa1-like proline 4-hydroxylase